MFYAEDVEDYFVKADQIELATYVDSLWADAEDAKSLEAPLGIHNACCHGCRQCRWDCDGDYVQ